MWFWASLFFFFPSSIKNLSILQVVSWVFYDLLHRFDLKRCYFLTHTLESFKYRWLTIKKNKKTNIQEQQRRV